MSLEMLLREQKKNKIAVEILEACSQWSNTKDPSMATLKNIVDTASEKILVITESEE